MRVCLVSAYEDEFLTWSVRRGDVDRHDGDEAEHAYLIVRQDLWSEDPEVAIMGLGVG